MSSDGVPPHSTHAERALLGALMVYAKSWDIVEGIIDELSFYHATHRVIYAALAAIEARDGVRDAITVSEYLERTGRLDEAGGFAYVMELGKYCVAPSNAEAYARIIRDAWIKRDLLEAAHEIMDSVFSTNGESADELRETAEQKIHRVASTTVGGPVSLDAAANETLDQIEAAYHAGGAIIGTPTGLIDLDERTNGLLPGTLTIIAGRPSMGKTALAINICEHVAIKLRKPCLFFSLEMPANQISGRIISSRSGVMYAKMRRGSLLPYEWDMVAGATKEIAGAPMLIEDDGSIGAGEIRSSARRVHRKTPLALVVIDYLQLVNAPRAENRNLALTEISASFKRLARELSVPVVSLSQLNRQVEGRQNKRPLMSDLRESGAIEQDADLILGIYRDEVYDHLSRDEGIAEIEILKQRNGPIGTVKTAFRKKEMRFDNLAS